MLVFDHYLTYNCEIITNRFFVFSASSADDYHHRVYATLVRYFYGNLNDTFLTIRTDNTTRAISRRRTNRLNTRTSNILYILYCITYYHLDGNGATSVPCRPIY